MYQGRKTATKGLEMWVDHDLFVRPGPKIKQLLSLRQWEKEHYVARQLQIPPEWITDGKVMNRVPIDHD